jgi:hypothetical protein
MDSMFKPEKYDRVYFKAFLYVFTLTLPHSISVNLAFSDNVLHHGAFPHYICHSFASHQPLIFPDMFYTHAALPSYLSSTGCLLITLYNIMAF